MNKLRALLSVAALTVGILIVIPLQLMVLWRGGRISEIFPYWFFKITTWAIGVRLDVRGTPSKDVPVLHVANHISWLDIFALGGVLKGSFVARADLAQWRLFGWLSKLRRTIFIDRENRARSSAHLEQMAERLEQGDSLILFPEGTSSDGSTVLPFKSSLFAVAERWKGERPLTVQPVSIAYTRINNMPLGRHFRPYVGWYGDMELGPHLWEYLTLGRVTAVVTFHETVTLEDLASRKEICAHCHGEIASALERLNAGYGEWQEAA